MNERTLLARDTSTGGQRGHAASFWIGCPVSGAWGSFLEHHKHLSKPSRRRERGRLQVAGGELLLTSSAMSYLLACQPTSCKPKPVLVAVFLRGLAG